MKNKISYKLNHDGLECQFCGKLCKNRNSLCNHERLCAKNPQRQISYFAEHKNEHSWNYGLSKETDSRLAQMGKSYSDNYAKGLYKSNSHKHTAEAKRKISDARIKYIANLGSKGYGIKGRYKGIYCDSSYELIYLIYCINSNINIVRNKTAFKYNWENVQHNYLPDFYLPDLNLYIEVKGKNQYYNKEKVDCKLQAVLNSGNNIKLLLDEDIANLQIEIENKYNLKGYKEICDYFYDK